MSAELVAHAEGVGELEGLLTELHRLNMVDETAEEVNTSTAQTPSLCVCTLLNLRRQSVLLRHVRSRSSADVSMLTSADAGNVSAARHMHGHMQRGITASHYM